METTESSTPQGIYYRWQHEYSDRPTLVFIHGLAGSLSAFLPYEQNFQNRYNTLAIDLRGHGKSKKFPHFKDYSLENFGRDIAEVLSLLNIERPILISHSFGTLVALEYLLRRPSNVLAAVFISPNFQVNKSAIAKISHPLLSLIIPILNLFPVPSKPGEHINYARFGYLSDWDIPSNIADIRNTTLRVYLYCLQHIYKFTDYDAWHRLRLPTYIIHGQRDSIIPLIEAKALGNFIPNAKLFLLDNGNHLFIMNNIAETYRLLQQCFNNQL